MTVAAHRIDACTNRIRGRWIPAHEVEAFAALGWSIADGDLLVTTADDCVLIVKALRAVVRLRKLDSDERKEQEAVLETYMHALGMLN